ncbi:MAG: DedA family protein [Deltaproteobacteria bacterium]|nr:DedA family protein [Deltaproteobacteria bacterium]
MESLIAQYGYTAIFIGALLEGETVLLIAAVLVQQGLLEFKWVLLASAAGAFAGDQFFFQLGRLKGACLFRHRAAWQHKLDRAGRWLNLRHGIVVLLYRFIYGMRAVIPFLLGAGRCRVGTFTLLSAASAMAWATVIGTGGYFFGEIFQRLILEGQSIQKNGLLGVALLASLVIGMRWRAHRRDALQRKKDRRVDTTTP